MSEKLLLFQKLLDLQSNPPQLIKDATNPHFGNDYISLGALLEAVVPELNSRGLLLMQPLSNIDGNPAIVTKIVDADNDEAVEYATPLVLDKETPQGVGSAITYFRRYGLLAALGFNADLDDDAEGATSESKSSSGQSGLQSAKARF